MTLVRARPARFDVALFGYFGIGNFGNKATLRSSLQLLEPRVPLDRILCIAADPTIVTDQLGIASHQIGRSTSQTRSRHRSLRIAHLAVSELRGLADAWRTLRGVRRLVFAGGGVLDDQHTTGQLALDVFRWCLAARLARTRVVFLAVGAGPLSRRRSRVLSRWALRLAHEVSYRDERSRTYMSSIGRRVTGDRTTPDLAFAFRSSRPAAPPTDGAQPCLALGVLWRGAWGDRTVDYERYEHRLTDLVVRMTDLGWRVRLVTGDVADEMTVDALLRRCELAGRSVENAMCRSIDDVIVAIGGANALVASRYHNVVAAILTDRPVSVLSYGPKTGALLEQFGLHDDHPIDDFSVDEIVDEILRSAEYPRPSHAERLGAFRARIAEAVAGLTDA